MKLLLALLNLIFIVCTVQAQDLNKDLIEKEYFGRSYQALRNQDATTICKMLADNYSGENIVLTSHGEMSFKMNKAQVCEAIEKDFAAIKQLKQELQERFEMHYNITLEKIEISQNKLSAKAYFNFKHRMLIDGKTVTEQQGKSVDTLIIGKNKQLLTTTSRAITKLTLITPEAEQQRKVLRM